MAKLESQQTAILSGVKAIMNQPIGEQVLEYLATKDGGAVEEAVMLVQMLLMVLHTML